MVPVIDGHPFAVEVLADGRVELTRPVIVFDHRRVGCQGATIRIVVMTSLESCQLGMALVDASRVAGALKRKIEDRIRRDAARGARPTPL
jgi:hypothetical protein